MLSRSSAAAHLPWYTWRPMHKAISIGLLLALLTRLSVPAIAQLPDASNRIRRGVVDIPQGARVDVRLLSERQLKGLRGEVLEDGFMLMDDGGKTGSQRIAFADVRSIKVVKSHTTRNVLIVIGVGLVVVLAFVVVRAAAIASIH